MRFNHEGTRMHTNEIPGQKKAEWSLIGEAAIRSPCLVSPLKFVFIRVHSWFLPSAFVGWVWGLVPLRSVRGDLV
jgi:hypothetical protein